MSGADGVELLVRLYDGRHPVACMLFLVPSVFRRSG